MKNITLNNYYDKLTTKQKKKFREKKGMLCYYEWFETLVDDCTPEEIGYIFLGLLHYDRFGGSVELPDFIAEKLNSDRALKMTFNIFMDKTCAASRDWINKHKLRSCDEDEEAIEAVKEWAEKSKFSTQDTDDDIPF